MSLASLQADVIDRRIQNGARVIFEDYTYYAERDCRLSPQGEVLAELAERAGMTREELIAVRQWAQQTTKKSCERLAQEMTLVYTLNEQRDRVLAAQYVSKGEAAETTRIVLGGDLLDLDCIYGGLLVRGSYVFVSELAFEEGLKRYEPAALLNGLIEERLTA